MGIDGQVRKGSPQVDRVLCSDQCPASGMGGNNMANMASSGGAGQGGRWSPDGPAGALQQELRLMLSQLQMLLVV